jgi:hypothetical protein
VRIRFGPSTLDFDTRRLTQDGRDIHLAPTAFDPLAAGIRAALGDQTRASALVRTAHGFGDRPPCWLEWGRRRFPPSVGEHVIGRDPTDTQARPPTS